LLRVEIMRHRVAVTAHRGSSGYAPENTLSALRRAIDDGADFAEIDVQLTLDGTVVVIHDADLKRVTGVRKKISEISYEEIKTLDAGSWFSSEFRGEPIPTLKEMLALAKGKIRLNVELKFHGRDDQLVEKVLQIIQDQHVESQCLISSMNYKGVMRVKTLNPDLITGFIVVRRVGDLSRFGTDFLSLNKGIASRRVIASAKRWGKGIHVWTVNDPKEMAHFINLSVDSIITDIPKILIEVMGQDLVCVKST
jgi:glycerophosphoryl diester phosphodiesterase